MDFLFGRHDLAPLTEARAQATALLLPDGRVVVAGGGTRRATEPGGGACEVACFSTTSVDLIDPARGTTSPLSPLRSARESAHGVVARGHVFVAGGLADHG